MKILRFTVWAAFIALFAAGCTSYRMAEGRYSSGSRGDYALVQNDLLFLHIAAPADADGKEAYWDWAGKYEIEDNRKIVPDMGKEELRKWNFYFDLSAEESAITVTDTGANTYFRLHREAKPLR